MLLNKFRELNRRDQAMLITLAMVLAFYVAYQMAWRPLANANRNLAQSNSVLRDSVQNMTQLAAQSQQLQQAGAHRVNGAGNGSAAPLENLAQLLDRTVAAQQLQMSRFQPGSTGDVQIRFDNIPFDNVLRWLNQLESEGGVTVKDLSISPGATTGLVNVSVRLFRA